MNNLYERVKPIDTLQIRLSSESEHSNDNYINN